MARYLRYDADPKVLRYLNYDKSLPLKTISEIFGLSVSAVSSMYKRANIKVIRRNGYETYTPNEKEMNRLKARYAVALTQTKVEFNPRAPKKRKATLEATRKREWPEPSYAHCLAGGEVSRSYFERLAAWEEGRRVD